MNEISLRQLKEISRFWLVYKKESGEPGHIQLSACANNFSAVRGDGSGGEQTCVGLRYEKNGFGYYELFNAGHTVIKCPLTPSLFAGAAKRRRQYEDIERRLNEFGWKTIAESQQR